ncbi:hypothetical protein [Magnetospirillum sp. SS-4]|uniref:hypothetical protein n=1 Tax=Magnetospirillum sp. SS-4 TaxID=2681465 RepID=UPI00137F12A7|nr:hypothetical protein [Magnetospirillum sp. SS-4]CAA7626053.1 conserved hypothetical protein [Magnetospirillum sp. SS-4]
MTLISSALSRLFADPWERTVSERTRHEPRLGDAGAAQDAGTAAETGELPALPAPGDFAAQPRFDLRNMSPRQFADTTHELYLEGTLSWDEFKMVGFPSELDPRYDETIGALTGEKANPDQPKDMLAQWEQRVDFEKRHNPDAPQTRTAETALEKLSWLSLPPLRLSA